MKYITYCIYTVFDSQCNLYLQEISLQNRHVTEPQKPHVTCATIPDSAELYDANISSFPK